MSKEWAWHCNWYANHHFVVHVSLTAYEHCVCCIKRVIKLWQKCICKIIHQNFCLWCLTPFICSVPCYDDMNLLFCCEIWEKNNKKLSTYEDWSEFYDFLWQRIIEENQEQTRSWCDELLNVKKGEIYSDSTFYSISSVGVFYTLLQLTA